MTDGLIKETGNSRLLKSTGALVPANYEAFRALLISSGLPIDMLLNPDGWQIIGTLLNKLTLLKDTTALEYGLSGDDATPANAFDLLAFASQYTWIRQKLPYAFSDEAASRAVVDGERSASSTVTVYYTDTMTVNGKTGTLTPGTISTMTVSYNTYSSANGLKGKWWSTSSANLTNSQSVYYTPIDAANATRNIATANLYFVYLDGSILISGYAEKELLYSSDENAYPHADTAEYQYDFIGKFESLPGRLVQTGVSGIYAAGSTASPSFEIILGFTPKAVIINRQRNAPTTSNYMTVIYTSLILGVAQQAAILAANATTTMTLTPKAAGFACTSTTSFQNETIRYVAFA